MKKPVIKTLLLVSMLAATGASHADGFFGNNNSGFGNFFGGNNNGYNNWPVWTPMYWMEEMTGNNFGNNNRYSGNYGNRYPNYYGNSYPQAPFQSSPYGMNPYMGTSPYANPYAVGKNSYVYRPAPTLRNYNTYPQSSFSRSGISPFSGNRLGSFPNMNFGNNFSRNPFQSVSPMNMGSGFPGMNSMSPMGGMTGFGSPFSPMSSLMSMGTMGMPGMNPMSSPMSSFGGSPFGGNSFNPFGR